MTPEEEYRKAEFELTPEPHTHETLEDFWMCRAATVCENILELSSAPEEIIIDQFRKLIEADDLVGDVEIEVASLKSAWDFLRQAAQHGEDSFHRSVEVNLFTDEWATRLILKAFSPADYFGFSESLEDYDFTEKRVVISPEKIGGIRIHAVYDVQESENDAEVTLPSEELEPIGDRVLALCVFPNTLKGVLRGLTQTIEEIGDEHGTLLEDDIRILSKELNKNKKRRFDFFATAKSATVLYDSLKTLTYDESVSRALRERIGWNLEAVGDLCFAICIKYDPSLPNHIRHHTLQQILNDSNPDVEGEEVHVGLIKLSDTVPWPTFVEVDEKSFDETVG